MQRVLFVIHHLKMGGAEAIVTNYALQMKKMGIDVAVLVIWHLNTNLYQKLKDAKIQVFHIFNQSNLFAKIANRFGSAKTNINDHILHVVSEYKPDVVHLHTFLRDTKIDKKLCRKWFFSLHSDMNRFLSQFNNNEIDNFSKQLSAGLHVVALTEKAKQDVLAFNANTSVTVIPNGIDIQGIKSQKYDREKLLRELELPKDSFILGHVGRFNKVKNHEKLFSIFSCILQKKPQAILLLIGDGGKEDRKRVHGLVKAYSFQNKVKFLGVRKDATALMSCFDAMALPSYQESFSLVLVEAQTQGVRCVASDTVPDDVICTDGCFKLSIDAPDEKWAELLLDSSRNINLSNLMKFDYSIVLKRLLDIYENLNYKANGFK